MRMRSSITAAIVALLALSASAQADPPPTASVTATVSVSASDAAIGSAQVITSDGGIPGSSSITYSLYADAACSGTATWADFKMLNADGTVADSTSTGTLAAGDYGLEANFSGDGTYAPATSACASFTVASQPQPEPQPQPQPQPVTLMASASPSAATYGNTIILSAAVQPAAATGTVTFTDAGSGSELCQASVSLGGASCTTPALAPGSYNVTASYGGDANDQPATSTTGFTITPVPAAAPVSTTTTTATTAFHFIIPPSITVTRPVNGARYTRDQPVRASYSCRDGSDAPGLASCRGTVAPGARIDTSQTGTQTFTVTGTSRSGESTLRTLHYVVAMPANQIAVFQPTLGDDGNGTVSVRVPGPGTITALETGWPKDRAQPRVGHQTVVSRGHATARRAGKLAVKLALVATGRRLLGHSHGSHLRVRLFITYTPTGGVARQASKYGVLAIK